MRFWFSKKIDNTAAEIATLQRQLESARRRITQLTLDNMQQAHEIRRLREFRGHEPQPPEPSLIGALRQAELPQPANTQIGLLFERATG